MDDEPPVDVTGKFKIGLPEPVSFTCVKTEKGHRFEFSCVGQRYVDTFDSDVSWQRKKCGEAICDRFGIYDDGHVARALRVIDSSITKAAEFLDEKLKQAGNGNTSAENAGETDLPLPLPGYVPFPAKLLPGPVGRFVVEAADAIGCDAAFVALPLLGVLARAIGNKRTIKLKRTWQELPILWCAIVGKSGSHKSPAIKAAMAPLQRKQAAAIEAHKQALLDHEQAKAQYERDMQQWRRSKTGEPPPWEPVEPALQRYVVDDITVEALADRLHRQYDGVLVKADELAGWLGGIAQYKGGQGSDLGHWLAAWSGLPLTVDRKTGAIKTVHVDRAAVSIVGGIQPGTLRRAIGKEHMQDGLCARLLLAMPSPRRVVWTDATINPATEAALDDVIAKLLAMEPAADESGKPEPYPLTLTPEAKAEWIAYFNRHRAEQTELDDDLAAAWSKLEAYTARFALIIQLYSWAAGEADGEAVDHQSMQAAIGLSDWFGGEARRVYGVLAETDADAEQRELVELIQRRGGSITTRDLAHSSRHYRGAGEAEAALERLAKRGLGAWEAEPTTGRPRMLFSLRNSGNGNATPVSLEENDPSVTVTSVTGDDTDAINRMFDEACDDEEAA